MGKGTWQATANTTTSFMFNRNLKNRFHRRDAPYLFVEDKAIAAAGPAGAELRRPVQPCDRQHDGGRRALRPDVGPVPEPVSGGGRPGRHRPARHGALHPRQRRRENSRQSEPPLPVQRDATVLQATTCSAARTTSRSALQMSREQMVYDRIRNGDILLELRDGVGVPGAASRIRPIVSDHSMKTWGVFLQDRWVIGRATINVGVRLDGVAGWLPEQSSPAGTYVGAAVVPGDRTSTISRSTSRRASASPSTSSATARPRSRPTTAASTTSSDPRLPKR